MRRVGAFCGLVLLILLATPLMAEASTGGSRVGIDNVDSDGDQEITNEARDAKPASRSGPQANDPCDYVVAIEDDLATAVWDLNNVEPVTVSLGDLSDPERRVSVGQSTVRVYSETGRWFNQTCPDSLTINGNPIPELVPEGSGTTIGQLILRSLGTLDPPEPGFQINPDGKQLTQFKSLFWIEPTYWDVDRVDTQTAGRVVSTVELVPVFSVWDPGVLGDYPVECEGPGEPWVEGTASEDYECGYTYRSVEFEPYTMTVTVQFDIQVVATVGGAPAPENLGPYTYLERTAETEVGVREIQVVETNG